MITHLTEKLALTAVVAAGVTAVVNAAMLPESQMFGHTLLGGSDPSEVALTFDDGPNDRATPALLDLLARHGARATFFMVGQHVRARPDLARAVHAAGHLVANHTMTHPWLMLKPERVIREELRGCNEALEDALGERVKFFRAPHGARRPAVLRIARELGLASVQWNAMGYDWEPIGAEKIVANISTGLHRAARRGTGANILLHDGDGERMGADRRETLRATELLLQRFATQGKRVVTLDAWG